MPGPRESDFARIKGTALVWGAFLALAVSACSPPAQPSPTATATSDDNTNHLTVLVGSTDLAVGENRIVFALFDGNDQFVRVDSVHLSFFRADDTGAVPRGEAKGIFRQWPYGQGVYTSEASFDKPSSWRMKVAAQVQGKPFEGSALLSVKEESLTPPLGSPAPRSLNRTVRDVDSLEELTTDPSPDPDLYSMTIAEALSTEKPLVVTFATPAFCQTATCGPQLDVIKELKTKYRSQANFIHVEVFDNPLEMRGDITKGRLSPAFREWGLQTEPYTFVVDHLGNIAAKFEGFVAAEELGPEIVDVLSYG